MDVISTSFSAKKNFEKGQKKYQPPPGPWAECLPNLSANELGRVAELATQFRLAVHGWDVYTGLGDHDILACKGDIALKIETKLVARQSTGVPLIRLRSSATKTRYEAGAWDIIVGYDALADVAFVYTEDECASRKSARSIEPDAAEAWHKLDAIFQRETAAA